MAAEALRGFPRTIQIALQEGKWDYATRLFNEEKYADDVKNDSWDLIPVIAEHLTEETRCGNNELFKCCVNLLTIISENANPEEAVLQFISEIEEATQETKFVTLLGILHNVIARIPAKKVNSLAWSFNAIHTYLGHLEIPDYGNLQGSEKLLVDNCETSRKIARLYIEVVDFYKNLIDKINKDTDQEVKYVLCKFLVQLLGNPLCYLTMDIYIIAKTDGRLLAEEIVKQCFKIGSDPFKLTEMYFEKHNDELIRPDLLSLANLFYLVYYEGMCFERVPKIYNVTYVFESTLPLLSILLEPQNDILTEKALKLSRSLFSPLEGQNLSYLLLDCKDNSKFCKSLTAVIIHDRSESVRKSALAVFTSYLKCFEVRGVYLVISNLMGILVHSGLIGYMISFYKDILNKEINNNEMNLPQYFKGPKLFALLRKFCNLHEKEKTNLKENSDQIIAVLNLLRYIALRDANNVTKFWDFTQTLEEIYFSPLRTALDLSRAHFELEINNLQKEDVSKPGVELDPSVTVNKIEIPKMSKEEKMGVLRGSLTVFDVISSLLTRVMELIEEKIIIDIVNS